MAEDQTGLMWSDPAWPWRPLHRSTALQYFEHSPFYDPNSNNAAARAQNLDPANEAVLRCGAAWAQRHTCSAAGYPPPPPAPVRPRAWLGQLRANTPCGPWAQVSAAGAPRVCGR